MEGSFWGETVRTADQMYSLLFPRLLALAERAWHKASWESNLNTDERARERTGDWIKFANTMAHRELGRLDKMGVAYHVTPPGARLASFSFSEATIVLVSAKNGEHYLTGTPAVHNSRTRCQI